MDQQRKKQVKALLFELALLYFGVLLFLFCVQRHYMYFPDARRPQPDLSGVGDMQVMDAVTSDGLTVSGWYKAPAAADKPVILLFHGNAANIANRAFKAR